MKLDTARVLNGYAQVLALGGGGLAVLTSLADRRWMDQPIAVIVLVASVALLRVVPVRLSKYSYLTQSGIPTLVGAISVGRRRSFAGLWLGVLVSDSLAPQTGPRGLHQRGPRSAGLHGRLRVLRRGAALHRIARPFARAPAGGFHFHRPVLLRDPVALLLHAPAPRQARVRREGPDPAVGDHLVSPHADRLRGHRGGAPARSRPPAGSRWLSRSACSACSPGGSWRRPSARRT